MATRHFIAGLVSVLALGMTVQLAAGLPSQAAVQAGDRAASVAADAPMDDHADRPEADGEPDDANHTAPETPENGSAAAEKTEGPRLDMPEQVPDHVERIHATIADFLAGEFQRLGPRLQDIR